MASFSFKTSSRSEWGESYLQPKYLGGWGMKIAQSLRAGWITCEALSHHPLGACSPTVVSVPYLEFQTAEPMVPFISWTPLCSSVHSFLQTAKNCHHLQCFLLLLFYCCLSMWRARFSDGYPTWHLSIPLPNVTPSGSSLRQLQQCSHVISQTILQTLSTVHVTRFLINHLLLCLPRCFVSSPIPSYHRTWRTQLTVRWLCIENIHSSASSRLFQLFLGNKVRVFFLSLIHSTSSLPIPTMCQVLS